LGGVAVKMGDFARARMVQEERLAVEREMGNQQGIGSTLLSFALIAVDEGQHRQTIALLEEAMPFLRQGRGPPSMPRLLNMLGDIARQAGDSNRAREYYDEALILAQEVGNMHERAWACSNLGYVAYHQHELAYAANWFRTSLALFQAQDDRQGVASCLAGLAATMHTEGWSALAVRLLAATHALLAAGEPRVVPVDSTEYGRTLVIVRAQLDGATFAAAWAEGQAMRLEQAITEALGEASLNDEVVGAQ